MKIDDDHLYHGAALIQIAEHPQFTAINSFKLKSGVCRSAYRINNDIGIYIKYASRPNSMSEYVFTFNGEHLAELQEIEQNTNTLFVVLVCVKAREICVLPYAALLQLIKLRQNAKGSPESTYNILVTVPRNKQLRVYVNKPNTKNKVLGRKPYKRSAFPNVLFP